MALDWLELAEIGSHELEIGRGEIQKDSGDFKKAITCCG